MHVQYTCTDKYGYIIAEINGKELQLFNSDEYNSLKQCETIEEICIKLNRKYKFLEGTEMNKNELKKSLNKTLINEYENILKCTNDNINNSYNYKDGINDYDKTDNNIHTTNPLNTILEYYIETHKIKNFFFILQSLTKNKDINNLFTKIDIGDFDELKTLKFCKDMTDVQKYCIENCFLKKYYYKLKWHPDFKDNDYQKKQALLNKFHIEDTYNKLKNTNLFILEILELEADRCIIDLTMNSLNMFVGKDRLDLYPRIHSMDAKMVSSLSMVESIDDMKNILSSRYNINKDLYSELVNKEVCKYCESFRIFNDVSCVYSYFKLKEQEIKNVLWIVDCVLQGRKNEIGSLLNLNK
ncbi:v-type proton atpase subunit d2 [Vairimorpha apis BRL 01]|uniref:V-type proton atpase subunit d2 n=1 Tax=Vairimorpha apis BRL 01 TaxID=1037528 RepID=T0MMG4_9MICR|nr:v-type proton atpase subunit d2 [Vairimorpha apis BRL 01]